MPEAVLEPGRGPMIESRADGSLWADGPFPDVLAVALALLEDRAEEVSEVLLGQGPPMMVPNLRPRDYGIERRGDIVDIRLANGRWVYRIVEWWDHGETAVCRIQYREDPSW